MARKHGVSVTLLGLLVACDGAGSSDRIDIGLEPDVGSDTGNPVENDNLGESGSACEAVATTALPFEQQTELGFSAADVLANAEGGRQETLRWQTLRSGSYGPESGAQTLDITITRVGDEARLVEYQQTGAAEIFLGCTNQLEIDVDVRLVSGGGALDETVRTKLVAARSEVATIYASLDPSELQGSLTISPGDLGQGWEWRALDLRIQVTEAAISGEFTPSFEQHTSDSVGQSAGTGPVAVFGLAPCTYGVAVPPDAQGKASSSSTLALLDAHRSAHLTGATQNAATFAFEPGDSVCQLFEDPNSPYSGPGVSIAGKLRVKTADGSIDGRWPVLVRGNPDASGALVGPVTIELDSNAQLAGQDLATRYGITQPSDAGYDFSGLRVSLSLTDAGWSGTIVVEGFTLPMCPLPEPGSDSSPGCPGSARTELASWQVRD